MKAELTVKEIQKVTYEGADKTDKCVATLKDNGEDLVVKVTEEYKTSFKVGEKWLLKRTEAQTDLKKIK